MSLFLKVFLWFWLAMALVIVALLVTVEVTRDREPFPSYTGMDRAMTAYGEVAAATYEREGRDGLARFFGGPQGDEGDPFYLFDERGTDVLARDAPGGAREAAKRAAATGKIERSPPGARMFVAHPVATGGGRRYVLVDSIPPGRHGHFSDRLSAQALRVLAVLLTAGLLCYWLARYIVSPVVKLRAATRQVAGGDFSARVSPRLGRRRDELAAMGRDFDQMAARIESLLNSQQRLLHDISHELRSPLARLAVALDLARRRAGDGAAGALDRIEREAARLNEMIGQLLALARWEGGADGLTRREPVDLARLVREVAEDADYEARAASRAVRVTRADECSTAGTPALLRSAVENVVRNAVRHTREGTEIEVSLELEGGAGGDNARAVIRVRDHGTGVPTDALADIFRPFYRVDDARDRTSGGTGLGLAITQRAVQLHGGTVTAANVPAGGLVVEIRLPASHTSTKPPAPSVL